MLSDPKKAARGQVGRVGPGLDRGGSRASQAAGGRSAMSVQRVEQRANASSARQRRSMSGPSNAGSASYRSSSSSNSASSNKGKRSADTTSSRKGSGASGRRPAASPARNSQDVNFPQWVLEKWYNLNPEHKRRIFSFLLLVVAALFFASLTLFHTVPFWAAIDHFFLTFFGWSTYILSAGLLVFAIVRVIETLRHTALVRGSLVIGLLILCLLISMESRLILGPMSAGVLTEILVLPLLSWAPPVQHILLFGLMIIVSIVTFRITFGHVLMVVYFVKRLFSDDRYIAGKQAIGARADDPSPYLGQRPQFSRYGGSRSGIPEAATQTSSSARGGRKASRIARVFNQGNEDQLDAVNAPDDFSYNDGNGGDIHDDKTVAFDDHYDDHYTFDDDVDEQDPLDDINIHRGKVSPVSRSLRNPQPLDLTDHAHAVQGAAQQALPFVDQDQEEPHGILLQTPEEMEASPPQPYVAKPIRRVRQVNQKDSVRAEKPMASIQLEQVQSVPARVGYNNTPNISSLWQLPNIDLLNSPEVVKLQTYGEDTTGLAKLIQDTLRSFRVEAEVRAEDISIGPTIIRFGIRPTGRPELMKDERTGRMVPVRDAEGQIVYETRTRVSRIMALQNDLALVLEAKTIRMEAPVPGRPYVGVEIPNKNSRLVTLREVLESKEYQAVRQKSKLAIGLGKDVAGQVRVGDLAKMPHLLIAGATGSGKCLAYDEPVFLSNGEIVDVQELVGQTVEVVGVTDTRTMQQIPTPATFTENGVREVFEIELDNGIILRRTGEHPLWAAQLDENQHVGLQDNGKAVRRTRAIGAGWLSAKDLRVCGNRPDFDGHVLLCPLTLRQEGTFSKSDADVILCASLLAEGGLNHYDYLTYMRTPRFSNADSQMVELVAAAVQEYDCKLVVSPHKTKGDVDYYISQTSRKGRDSGNPIARLVRDWGIDCLATEKTIPDWVFQLSNAQIALFLRVFIDCDGWISVRGHRSSVNVSLANPILVQQLGQLALRLGITGTYTHKENGYAGAWTWTTYMVEAWQECIGSLVKKEKLALAVNDQIKSRESAATVWNAWRRARPLYNQKFADCPQGYEWRKIVAIRRVECPTVNIEVHSENHAFVGYAVEHNSVMINTIIASIAMQATPDDVRMLMVDPKMVELNMYNGIPHLLSPVVIEVEKVVSLLKNAITEMERRYRLFSQLGVRNLDGYRKMRMEKIAQGDTSLNNLPAIVIIIDELADLMMAAPEEVEGMICRLAQLARATGIHLVVATQRPSVDVITGLIKANIPTRISFMVSSAVDSRTIIDMGGAERLLGRGDMLYLPADAGRPERIQGAFLTDEEAQHLTEYWHQQAVEHAVAAGQPIKEEELEERVEPGWELRAEASGEDDLEDDLLYRAEEIVREYGRASISLLQRRLKIGYSRAARLIDLLEQHGIIGQSESNGRAREVYDHDAQDNYHQADDDAHSMADEADDIMQEERARNDFLRNQAARFQGQGQNASAQAYIDEEDEG